MKEYIEREAAIAVIYGQHVGGKEACENARPNTYGADLREIVADIEEIPAADVRPVIVCTNCEHNNHCLTQEFVDDCGKIPLDRNTFFCADGERKSNA